MIEPPTGGVQRLQAGQPFGFGLVPVGKALGLLPTVLQAWQRALRTGLGPRHTSCTLLEVIDEMASNAYQISASSIKRNLHSATPVFAEDATLHLHPTWPALYCVLRSSPPAIPGVWQAINCCAM